jgi:hypothetical protein
MATAKKAAAKKATDGTVAKRKVKTVTDLKNEIAETKAKLATLEQRAYASELKEAIESSGVVAAYKAIKDSAKGIDEITVLAAIGAAVGIKRLVITQKEAATRTSTKVKTTTKV